MFAISVLGKTKYTLVILKRNLPQLIVFYLGMFFQNIVCKTVP